MPDTIYLTAAISPAIRRSNAPLRPLKALPRTVPAWVLVLLLPVLAQAAGPEKIATLERALWPEPITTADAFDRASQAEILTFARLLAATPLTTEADIQTFTGLKAVNPTSVIKWQGVTRQRLQQNYAQACGNCRLSTSWSGLLEAAKAPLPEAYLGWQQAGEGFHRRYLYEQVRLAALFPRITSEIDQFESESGAGSDASAPTEVTGFELQDRHFLLSYDDGPSAERTPSLIRALEAADVSAYFFVLGEKLVAQAPSPALYRNQCLASHGYEHKSHQKWDAWLQSVDSTRRAIQEYSQSAAETPVAFRPPYGQRHQALVDVLAARQEKLVLWNIDSQDWNRKLTAQQVQDRVQTLMLLWRRGVILYHDIHPKAEANLPALLAFQQQAGLKWQSCREAF